MGELINLRLARKARRRATEAGKAEANRAKFGQTKAEKVARHKEEERRDREHETKKLDKPHPKSE